MRAQGDCSFDLCLDRSCVYMRVLACVRAVVQSAPPLFTLYFFLICFKRQKGNQTKKGSTADHRRLCSKPARGVKLANKPFCVVELEISA